MQLLFMEYLMYPRDSALHLWASGEKIKTQRGEGTSPRSQLGSGRAVPLIWGCLLPEALIPVTQLIMGALRQSRSPASLLFDLGKSVHLFEPQSPLL